MGREDGSGVGGEEWSDSVLGKGKNQKQKQKHVQQSQDKSTQHGPGECGRGQSADELVAQFIDS